MGRVAIVEVEAGGMLVARLWRWDEERLRKDAERDHRERLVSEEVDPDYSISVWAMPKPEKKAVDDLMQELCQHIQAYRSAAWVTFTTRQRLHENGFSLRLSEPPPRHFDVVLGNDLESADFKGLEAILGEEPRRRFPACTV